MLASGVLAGVGGGVKEIEVVLRLCLDLGDRRPSESIALTRLRGPCCMGWFGLLGEGATVGLDALSRTAAGNEKVDMRATGLGEVDIYSGKRA
jgi:hypothetical protein